MFDEFLECTDDKDELETVTIVCDDCIMQITLKELRKYIHNNRVFKKSFYDSFSDRHNEALEV